MRSCLALLAMSLIVAWTVPALAVEETPAPQAGGLSQADAVMAESVEEECDCEPEPQRQGHNFWFEAVSPSASSLRWFYAEDGSRYEYMSYVRVLTFGYDFVWDMVSVTVRNSLVEAGQVGYGHDNAGYFMSPAAIVKVRPIEMLAIEADLEYVHRGAFDDVTADATAFDMVMGGVHALFEPFQRYVGTVARYEVGIGFKGGYFSPEADEAKAGSTFMVGGRIGAIFGLGDAVAAVISAGCYAGFDPHDSFSYGKLNWEWTAAFRAYPFGF